MPLPSFSEFLAENYKNLIGPDSEDKRRHYADQVWKILVKSYQPMGGLKGNGFNSKEDMIKNIPFWKLYTKGDKVVAAAFYKDRNGRKAVAIATDGSDLGRVIVSQIFKASLGVAWGEKSGPALATMMKVAPFEDLKSFILEPKVVAKLLDDPIETEVNPDKLDPKDRFTWDKFPQLRPYFYVREIGGEKHLKASFGTPDTKIR
ncbi:MAG: hypothetical protein WCY93_12270 [Anaerolineaceae bacterium]